jgi:1-acyl-sn-glycerol-3-phosphate acyltransferase
VLSGIDRKETKDDEAGGFRRVPTASRQRLNSAKSFGSMRSMFHSLANHAARLLMKLLFACVARVRVVRRENANHDGGFLLAANHISHFDPFIISSVVRRKIDWMAMAEFFPYPVLGFLLRAVDAFPADRHRADRTTIRTAIERLKHGRIVGVFPEGGIRDGARSLLEGAPMRPGASTLAHIAGAPIVPSVIVGSDRLYSKKSWLPLRRTPIWVAFGDPIPHFPNLEKSAARARTERELAAAFKILYAELRETFSLTPNDLPHPPRERMQVELPIEETARSQAPKLAGPRVRTFRRFTAIAVDSLMCTSMNVMQSRHRLHARSRDEFERYVAECEKFTAHDFYAVPRDCGLAGEIGLAARDQERSAIGLAAVVVAIEVDGVHHEPARCVGDKNDRAQVFHRRRGAKRERTLPLRVTVPSVFT